MLSCQKSRRDSYVFCKMFFFFLFLFLVVSISDLKSQGGYCYEDCDSTQWIPNPPSAPYTFGMTLPCGEPVIVLYRIRYACNIYWDLYIERVIFINGNIGGEDCGLTMTLTQMMENIVNQMLVQNPMNFPPANNAQDTCVETYRVLRSACWLSTFTISAGGSHRSDNSSDTGTIFGYLAPCLSTHCCVQAYKVCMINGQKVITHLFGNSTPGECDPNVPPICQPICN